MDGKMMEISSDLTLNPKQGQDDGNVCCPDEREAAVDAV
jgi:hypothetical protein